MNRIFYVVSLGALLPDTVLGSKRLKPVEMLYIFSSPPGKPVRMAGRAEACVGGRAVAGGLLAEDKAPSRLPQLGWLCLIPVVRWKAYASGSIDIQRLKYCLIIPLNLFYNQSNRVYLPIFSVVACILMV